MSVVLSLLLVSCAPMIGHRPYQKEKSEMPTTKGRVAPENFPEVISDPYEPVNRAIGYMNGGIMLGVVQPTSYAYRKVIPRPVRSSLSRFRENITYPTRLVNHVLQGRWNSTGRDTLRFVTNSTIGLGGFFDPATRWNMPRSHATFGQTFTQRGWSPSRYMMLPIFGPSDEMHVTGLLAD